MSENPKQVNAQTANTSEVATRYHKPAESLHYTVIEAAAEAQALSIEVLGSNASISHAVACAKDKSAKLVGIHDGTPASVSEAFAVAIRTIAEGRNCVVLRHNFQPGNKIPEGMALYGTGGAYNNGHDQYDPQPEDDDHHADGTLMSPAGLAWRHHGPRALANLGCPNNLTREVHEIIENGIIRDIDWAAAAQNETPQNVYTVARAMSMFDHESNKFDDSVAAFAQMAAVAKQIIIGIAATTILDISGEEKRESADLDFVWYYVFSGADEIDGPTLTPTPKNSWQKWGYDLIEKAGFPTKCWMAVYGNFEDEVIPTAEGKASEEYGMTVHRLIELFGRRYAYAAFEILHALIRAYMENEKKYYGIA